jgi:hypothetical protein
MKIEINDLHKDHCVYDLVVDLKQKVFHLYDHDDMVSMINTIHSSFCRELIEYLDRLINVEIERDINEWKYVVYTPGSGASFPPLINEYKPGYEGTSENPFIKPTVDLYKPFVERLSSGKLF